MPALTRRAFLLAATATAFCAALGPAAAQIRKTYVTLTPAGAHAEVTQALREGETITVTARFTALDASYPGEVIYQGLTRSEAVQGVYLKTGDRDFGVWSEGGQLSMPEALVLPAHPGGVGPKVVGEWQATFIAPTLDIKEITLLLPNMLAIGHFVIRDH